MNSVLLLVFALVGSAVACTLDSECGAEECCLRLDPLIMSKRAVAAVAPVDSLLLPNRLLGKCSPRLDEGRSCGGFYTCGCKTGLRCQITDELQLLKRVVAIRPGVCQKDPEALFPALS